ncbi:MAG: flippase-like domain-containing protein [Methanophagales archaeon ANME-1-THS]|nr:MAG: flippase-like domain-containing protein [Methanophagales archaeon ANME-1-THS]
MKNFAGVLISLASILLIFKLTETSVTWSVIQQANPELLVLAFLLHALFWLFWAVRLRLLFSFLNHRISLGYAFDTTLASMFLAAITPSSAGGEPVRVKMLVDKGATIGSASAVILAERLLDAIFFIAALAIFTFLSGFSTKFGLKVGMVFFVSLVIFIAFLYLGIKKPERTDAVVDKCYPALKKVLKEEKAERVCEYIKKELRLFSDALLQLANNSFSRIIAVILLTAAVWLSEFLVPSAVLMAFNQSPFVLYSITAQLIIVIVSLVPLTPGSSGIAEASMFYLYARFVTAHTVGVLVGVWRAFTYFSNLLVGFIITAKVLKTRYSN